MSLFDEVEGSQQTVRPQVLRSSDQMKTLMGAITLVKYEATRNSKLPYGEVARLTCQAIGGASEAFSPPCGLLLLEVAV